MIVYVKGYKVMIGDGEVSVGDRVFCGETQECLQKGLDFILDSRLPMVKGYKYRGSIHSSWARMVKHRDGYVCKECGAGDVQAHHIIPVSRGGGYEMDNGVALCVSCHLKKHR